LAPRRPARREVAGFPDPLSDPSPTQSFAMHLQHLKTPSAAPRMASILLTVRDVGNNASSWDAMKLDAPAVTAGNGMTSIRVETRVKYQQIEGFGGAFTEAAAVTLQKMPAAKQEEILKAYFDPVAGHAYSICRTHINSCDFALGNYAYCEQNGDFELKTFSIERDRRALLPMIQRALKISSHGLNLFASPWSPPAWMKTSGKMNQGGKLKPECREVWARYYARYIREYEKEGIPIWGLTVQNEPASVQPWDSCIYTGEEERDFILDYLGPVLAKEGLGHVKIIIWDHNRDFLYERARAVLEDPAAAQYVWGTGFHGHVGDHFANVQRVHEAWPDKKLLFTEGCREGGPHHGSWLSGERYARSIIQDLNNWTVGWVDWNLLLNHEGGPNHVGNFCSAPILADTRTGEIHYQSSYYYLGHFSRFIRPGAWRILSSSSSEDLEVLACENSDGSLVIVVLNRTETPIPFRLQLGEIAGLGKAPRRSIQTIVLGPDTSCPT
jgi:glucosylceramidase